MSPIVEDRLARAAAKKAVASGEDAYGAAYQACVALFAPTRDSLERSALDLVDRMLAVTPESLTAEGSAERVGR